MTHKNHYDEAFSNFTPYLDELLNDFRAIKLSSLLTKYIAFLVESALEKDTANNYVAQRLKDRIIKHYGKKITFAQSSRKNESQFVYNSNIDVQNVINVASELKNINKPADLELLTDELHEKIVNDYKSDVIYHAPSVLRQEISSVKGIIIEPLNPDDITEKTILENLPDLLLTFFTNIMR